MSNFRVCISIFSLIISAGLFVEVVASENKTQSSFVLFESGQVRPLALSPDGQTLFAVNTPDNRLEVFNVSDKGLNHLGSVSVGLEPVSVAVRSNNEVWVVNHLSDSISVVKINNHFSLQKPIRNISNKRLVGRVVKTLHVGDEPRDIVFGGAQHGRAFITTAHRGQNAPFDPKLTTPGIGRADVWVFDAAWTGKNLGGEPLSIITLFGDTPRALAVSPGGEYVYAAIFHSGNKTTTLFDDIVKSNSGLPLPLTNFESITQPTTSLIVQFNDQKWVDGIGRDWSKQVKFSLPDKDVFVIDANANPPTQISGEGGFYSGVGTVLFNMITNPKTGTIYVANTDAKNLTRFEGTGKFGGTTVRGHTHESRITVLGKDGFVGARHLNKHIDYNSCCAAIPNDENNRSLAFPMDMAITQDGKTLYVAAFGSSKIGIFDTNSLENDNFEPSTDKQIKVSGGGPSGLVLDAKRKKIYALTRFDNSISIIDTVKNKEIAHVAMFNPEPKSIVAGRPFLYDASFTSSHGDSACASCHVFANFDSLAWDLGDPDATEINNPGPFTVRPRDLLSPVSEHYRPMKGPMVTQSLRGMANHGSMHWRGDRTGGNDEPSSQPNSGTFNEELAFKKFNVAFGGLNGRHEPLTDDEMKIFANFALQITYPPNPIRNLDNSLTPNQSAGKDFYFGNPSDIFFNCNGCHVLDPDANKEFGVAKPGFFGTDGRSSFENLSQVFKTPHLRNLYQKVGMFGQKVLPFDSVEFIPFFLSEPLNNNSFMGDQVRGFGFLHDGSTDTLFRFHGSVPFVQRPAQPPLPANPRGFSPDLNGIIKRKQVEQFMLAFDSNLAPIVGQQVTLTWDNKKQVDPRIDLLMARSEAGECDLVAKTQTRQGRREVGFLYRGDGSFDRDIKHKHPITDRRLRKRARRWHGEITYTCVPVGSGIRIALDRDEDGIWNGDKLLLDRKPSGPSSKLDSKND
ncbi:MAG: YncE family protein [Methylococcales bacterium]|nr:YncE family protein [Methylococcales bacterium]